MEAWRGGSPRPSRARGARAPRRRHRSRRPGSACRALRGDVPGSLLVVVRPDHPRRRVQRDGPGVVRLHRAVVPRIGADTTRPGHRRFLLRRVPVPAGRRRRDPSPPARDDAADRDGDHRRLHRIGGDGARLVRPRVLVGARRPRHHHAARPLDGDAGDRPGPGRPPRPGRAVARQRRTHHRHGDGGGGDRRPPGRRRGAGATRGPGTRRRGGGRRRRRGRRVDGHR